MYGSNTTAATVNATLASASDLTNLAEAINNSSGATGITATLSADKGSIVLDQAQGYNISLTNVKSTGKLSLQGEADGSAVQVSGAATAGAATVGGTVSFSSATGFNVEASSGGGLFTAGTANISSLQSVSSIDITSTTGAAKAINTVDAALSQIDAIRGGLGAVQNRFQSTISNLSNISMNLSAARSQIMDADVAQETSNMTKENILQQAGIAILAQANQQPSQVLALLK